MSRQLLRSMKDSDHYFLRLDVMMPKEMMIQIEKLAKDSNKNKSEWVRYVLQKEIEIKKVRI
jgi:predicted DNA-binding protein